MMWEAWFKILAVLILAPIGGAVLMGIDRILTARMQNRVGPPLLQPIYDVFKLLGKEPILLNRIQVIYAFLHLAFIVLSVIFLVMGQDLLMLLFIIAFANIALILGGMCVRSPYSRIGSQREILQMVAYEPILVLMVVGIYLVTGSFLASDIAASGRPLLFSLPLIFIAFLLVLTVKLQKSPFDLATSHHAHQEIVKGITIEYSGPYLAILEIAHFYKIALLFIMIMLFWLPNIYIALALAAGCYFLEIVIDNAFARLTPIWMLQYMWTVGLGMAFTNIIWLYMGRGL
ncbi:MAG: complex I subunit 1 family protein [Kiritimatiellales bacterium]|jgi:formate hydrogenlyase subunit 4